MVVLACAPVRTGIFNPPAMTFPMHFLIRVSLGLLAVSIPALAAPENRLRNGSFEGGLLYWHNISPKDHTLVRMRLKSRHASARGLGALAAHGF